MYLWLGHYSDLESALKEFDTVFSLDMRDTNRNDILTCSSRKIVPKLDDILSKESMLSELVEHDWWHI